MTKTITTQDTQGEKPLNTLDAIIMVLCHIQSFKNGETEQNWPDIAAEIEPFMKKATGRAE